MKAAVLENWKNIRVQEVPNPVLQTGEALIKVGLAGVCGSDVHIYNGDNPIARAPVVPGHEFMGSIADLNMPFDGLSVGDRVVVQPLKFCGECAPCKRGFEHVCEKLIVIGVNQDGGYAQFVSVPIDTLTKLPDNMPDEVAVLAEPFSIGYHACARGGIQAGQRVAVIGGGPIGFYSAIVARELGARHVVITEPLEARRLMVESFGFPAYDPTADITINDVQAAANGDGFDLVIETSGVDSGLDFAVEIAAVRGTIVTLGFPAKNYARYNITRGIVKELSVVGSRVCPRDEFRKTLDILQDLNLKRTVDFAKVATPPRSLEELEQSILDVESNSECAKILIKPE